MEKPVFTAEDFVRMRLKGKTLPFAFPELCIFGFLPGLDAYIRKKYRSFSLNAINPGFPYTLFEHQGIPMAYISPSPGAPFAATLLEETIALGTRVILYFGMAGSIDPRIEKGTLLIPDSAERDEGTSPHYDPDHTFSFPNPDLYRRICSFLQSQNIPHTCGKVWTTDAPYRETPGKIREMRSRNCVAVDMESSALMTVANFRHTLIAGILVISDSLVSGEWTPPSLRGSIWNPRNLFELTLKILGHALSDGMLL
jgi:purine-nucleoside phosphorylase